MKRRTLLWAALPAAIVLCDQLVKLWAQRVLQYMDTLPLWEGVFHLTYARNTGAAFSMLQGARWFFVGLTAVMLALLVYALHRGWIGGTLGRLATLFIVGGGAGNLIDRVHLGYVVDLFDFRLIHFAIFNVADSFITVGGVLLFVWILFIESKKEGKRHDPPADGGN